MRYLFLTGLLFFFDPLPLLAGWGGGSCAPVGAPVFRPVHVDSGYRWECAATDSDCWGLRWNGIQVGAWRQSTGEYRPLVNGQWGELAQAPIEPPVKSKRIGRPIEDGARRQTCPCCGENCNCTAAPCGKPDCRCVLRTGIVDSDGVLNFGIDRDSVREAPDRVINGKIADRRQVLAAIGAPKLADDSQRLCLTVIGADAERKPVLTDLKTSPALLAWKDKLKVNSYDPSHWAVKNSGFFTGGHPTIYLQRADGHVLHRQDEYHGSDALTSALRNADPAYDPKRDPNLNNPLGGLDLEAIMKQLQAMPAWVWIGLAIFAYLHWSKKQ